MWFASRFMAIVWVGTGLFSRIVLAAVFHQRIRLLLCQPWARKCQLNKPVPIEPIQWPWIGSGTTQEKRNTQLKWGLFFLEIILMFLTLRNSHIRGWATCAGKGCFINTSIKILFWLVADGAIENFGLNNEGGAFLTKFSMRPWRVQMIDRYLVIIRKQTTA